MRANSVGCGRTWGEFLVRAGKVGNARILDKEQLGAESEASGCRGGTLVGGVVGHRLVKRARIQTYAQRSFWT